MFSIELNSSMERSSRPYDMYEPYIITENILNLWLYSTISSWCVCCDRSLSRAATEFYGIKKKCRKSIMSWFEAPRTWEACPETGGYSALFVWEVSTNEQSYSIILWIFTYICIFYSDMASKLNQMHWINLWGFTAIWPFFKIFFVKILLKFHYEFRDLLLRPISPSVYIQSCLLQYHQLSDQLTAFCLCPYAAALTFHQLLEALSSVAR